MDRVRAYSVGSARAGGSVAESLGTLWERAVWAAPAKVDLISLRMRMFEALAPDGAIQHNPASLCDAEALQADVAAAGFQHVSHLYVYIRETAPSSRLP